MNRFPDNASTTAAPSFKTVLVRGWRKKCPHCGQGDIYKSFLKVGDHCPACGHQLLSNQGDLLGLMMLIDRVLFLIPLVTIFCLCAPHAPLVVSIPTSVIVMVLFVVTLPNRNGACLAFDYYISTDRHRPAGP